MTQLVVGGLAVLCILWLMRGLFLPRGKKYYAISQDEMEKMQQDGAKVFDVRLKRDYDKGHIPGAIFLAAETADKEFHKLYPKKDAPYIFYCTMGVRADIVMESLEKQGYKNLHSFKRIKRYTGELEKS